MCNLLLADEINRTSSKTQAALLEVMEEGNATVDGKTYEIPKPFTVIATQNPVRFCRNTDAPAVSRWIVLWSNSPWVIRTLKARSISCGIVRRSSRWICFQMISSREEVQQLQQEVKEVEVADDILRYIHTACRSDQDRTTRSSSASAREEHWPSTTWQSIRLHKRA